MLTEQRRNVRDALEKSIALWKATGSSYVIIIIIIITVSMTLLSAFLSVVCEML
jgi:hypothetical protein